MIKKALVTLLSSAILATTAVSGVVTTPMVAYAAETKVIKITEADCVNAMELGDSVDMVSESEYGGVLKVAGVDGYFLYIPEFNKVYNGDVDADEIKTIVYKLPEMSKGSSIIIQTGSDGVIVEGYEYTDADYIKYTISYDGSSYSVTNRVTYEEDEKAKYNKWISDMVVCKHQSAGNVTLSASEKKGTLTVTKADIKTATKLDMMLKSKKALTIKVKATSKTKAVSQFKSLRKLTGHANTYGVLPWIEADQGIPYTEKISSSKFKKSGSYYTINISKSISKNYTYLCKAYENAFKRAEKHKTGYSFKTGTHLCDCSDVVKIRVMENVISNVHIHAWSGDSSRISKLDYKDQFKVLAGNKQYDAYVCEGLANLAKEVSSASGIKSDYIANYELNHAWIVFTVKDSSGKNIKCKLDNGHFNLTHNGLVRVNDVKCNDVKAINKIIGAPYNH